MNKETMISSILILVFVVASFFAGLYAGQNFEITAKNGGHAESADKEVVPSNYAKKLMSYEDAMKQKKPALVFFYVDWCGYCKRFAPLVPKLKKQYKNKVNIVMVNCEDQSNGDILSKYEIKGYPSIYMVNPESKDSVYIEPNNYYPISSISAYIDNYLKK